MTSTTPLPAALRRYNIFLLLVAGLGGLLYGVDVGIIAGALPYLEATSKFTSGQLSLIVAAVLLGSVISTLFAGLLSDWLGRKTMMIISGALFVISIPAIALSHGYGPLIMGRLLQGISGGFIGVVVPLYLAECLNASNRGKGTGIFQWLLTFGILAAAIIGLYFSAKVDAVKLLGDKDKVFAVQEYAWRGIFWVSLPPGILFVIGGFMLTESPRWLYRKGRIAAARAALLRSRTENQMEVEIKEMELTIASENTKTAGSAAKESLFHKKYVIPFVLACIILACNQATGVNSILAYTPTVLLQAGLSDLSAHQADLYLKTINFLATIGAVLLVERKGRKFLLSMGTLGIIFSLFYAGIVFRAVDNKRVECRDALQAMVDKQSLKFTYDDKLAAALAPKGAEASKPTTLVVIYSYGDFHSATPAIRSDAGTTKEITTNDLPKTKVEAWFSNPAADLDAMRAAPLHIDNAIITPIPGSNTGWTVAVCLYVFMAFYAVGPGVCVWLALSELMPTRIRSNGMSIALLFNQAVSTTIAAVYLPTVGKHGNASMMFLFAGCTVIYFITAAFFLPETKGKTLEEIEAHFERKKT